MSIAARLVSNWLQLSKILSVMIGTSVESENRGCNSQKLLSVHHVQLWFIHCVVYFLCLNNVATIVSFNLESPQMPTCVLCSPRTSRRVATLKCWQSCRFLSHVRLASTPTSYMKNVLWKCKQDQKVSGIDHLCDKRRMSNHRQKFQENANVVVG
jgi:hypothetical protein